MSISKKIIQIANELDRIAGPPIRPHHFTRPYPADTRAMVNKTEEALKKLNEVEKLLSSVGSGGGADTGSFPDELPDNWHDTFDETHAAISRAKGKAKSLLRQLKRL